MRASPSLLLCLVAASAAHGCGADAAPDAGVEVVDLRASSTDLDCLSGRPCGTCRNDSDCWPGWSCRAPWTGTPDGCVVATCGRACATDADCVTHVPCLGGKCLPNDRCLSGTASVLSARDCQSDQDCLTLARCYGGLCHKACNSDEECTSPAVCHDAAIDAGVCAELPFHCVDRMLDGDETDIDCGGACSGCSGRGHCAVDADCLSAQCEDHVCTPPAWCAGNCGGPCACPIGAGCVWDRDCANPDGGVAVCVGWLMAQGGDVGCGSTCITARPPGTCRRQCGQPEDCPGTCCDPFTHSCGPLEGFDCGNSNCGVAGQWCFECENCGGRPSVCAPTGDYCAQVCWAGGCQGCCGDLIGITDACLRGDDDTACGAGGSSCVACPNGTHCTNGHCQ